MAIYMPSIAAHSPSSPRPDRPAPDRPPSAPRARTRQLDPGAGRLLRLPAGPTSPSTSRGSGAFAIQQPTGANGRDSRSSPSASRGWGSRFPCRATMTARDKVELAVYIPSLGAFYLPPGGRRPRRGQVPFGIPAVGRDARVPGDYDGSGRTEVAVYDPDSRAFIAYRPGRRRSGRDHLRRRARQLREHPGGGAALRTLSEFAGLEAGIGSAGRSSRSGPPPPSGRTSRWLAASSPSGGITPGLVGGGPGRPGAGPRSGWPAVAGEPGGSDDPSKLHRLSRPRGFEGSLARLKKIGGLRALDWWILVQPWPGLAGRISTGVVRLAIVDRSLAGRGFAGRGPPRTYAEDAP